RIRRGGGEPERGPGGGRGGGDAGPHGGAVGRDPRRAGPGAAASGSEADVMSVLRHAVARWLSRHQDDLVAWRRHIHAHPELGRQEFATTQFVAERLADAGLNPKVLPGG